MRKILCDICTREIKTDQIIYKLELSEGNHRSDTNVLFRLDMCDVCVRDAKASVAHWQKSGIVTKYT